MSEQRSQTRDRDSASEERKGSLKLMGGWICSALGILLAAGGIIGPFLGSVDVTGGALGTFLGFQDFMRGIGRRAGRRCNLLRGGREHGPYPRHRRTGPQLPRLISKPDDGG